MPFRYKIFLAITPAVFLLDQITKALIRAWLPLGSFVPVISGYFDIVHVQNRGAAFGMFSSAASSFRIPFFYIISAIAVVIIVMSLIKLSEKERLLPVIFSLILAGIAGNVLDRILYGSVTDFLSVHIRDKVFNGMLFGYNLSFRMEWPSFNIADSAISVAMVLLILSLFKTRKE